jgi:hypothetical protein
MKWCKPELDYMDLLIDDERNQELVCLHKLWTVKYMYLLSETPVVIYPQEIGG